MKIKKLKKKWKNKTNDLLYDPYGHGDLCGRFDLVYDPERSQGH